MGRGERNSNASGRTLMYGRRTLQSSEQTERLQQARLRQVLRQARLGRVSSGLELLEREAELSAQERAELAEACAEGMLLRAQDSIEAEPGDDKQGELSALHPELATQLLEDASNGGAGALALAMSSAAGRERVGPLGRQWLEQQRDHALIAVRRSSTPGRLDRAGEVLLLIARRHKNPPAIDALLKPLLAGGRLAPFGRANDGSPRSQQAYCSALASNFVSLPGWDSEHTRLAALEASQNAARSELEQIFVDQPLLGFAAIRERVSAEAVRAARQEFCERAASALAADPNLILSFIGSPEQEQLGAEFSGAQPELLAVSADELFAIFAESDDEGDCAAIYQRVKPRLVELLESRLTR